MKKGFTLIEILVVISVMGILGLVFTGILIQALRAQNKVRILNQVKQNGQNVLDKLSNEFRQAEKVICVGRNLGNSINTALGFYDTIVIFRQGTYSRFRFYPPTPGNGYIKRNDFSLNDITEVTSESDLCTETADRGGSENLTDTDPISGISLTADKDSSDKPIFKIDSQSGYNDIITMKFRAAQGVSAGRSFETAVKEGGILFITSVQVRGTK